MAHCDKTNGTKEHGVQQGSRGIGEGREWKRAAEVGAGFRGEGEGGDERKDDPSGGRKRASRSKKATTRCESFADSTYCRAKHVESICFQRKGLGEICAQGCWCWNSTHDTDSKVTVGEGLEGFGLTARKHLEIDEILQYLESRLS